MDISEGLYFRLETDRHKILSHKNTLRQDIFKNRHLRFLKGDFTVHLTSNLLFAIHKLKMS